MLQVELDGLSKPRRYPPHYVPRDGQIPRLRHEVNSRLLVSQKASHSISQFIKRLRIQVPPRGSCGYVKGCGDRLNAIVDQSSRIRGVDEQPALVQAVTQALGSAIDPPLW
ncbi:hypothetical protein [Mycolicibacterium sp. GF69]|uniref:hypothetical protein n=1 Tax=Mycolicibacterium sp. GF69 TaxID=2267251 RepID=UPI001057A731|nr:hypothetical protein [Mycolicibacterium sp. GF69]